MSRSGYTDDCDDALAAGRWVAQVKSAIRGKRGQAFLREMIAAMDAMPEKALITDELVTAEGDCCALGVVCKARGIDVSRIDIYNAAQVGKVLGIAGQLAAEVTYWNDEWGDSRETPEQLWVRMRAWADSKLAKEAAQ